MLQRTAALSTCGSPAARAAIAPRGATWSVHSATRLARSSPRKAPSTQALPDHRARGREHEAPLARRRVAPRALINIGGTPRPSNLGIQDFDGFETLCLCPSTANCISTAEEAYDRTHYAPPLTYNPACGRGSSSPISQEQAMQELVEAVMKLQPSGFSPTIIDRTEDYLYVEYESPLFGFIDDVEFWFRPGPEARVEYRSCSRVGEADVANINRKRIKAIREELETKGWRSTGF